MSRVLEALAAAVIVAVVVGVIAWRTGADVVLVSLVAGLVMFVGYLGSPRSRSTGRAPARRRTARRRRS